jgi:hypothetical protein
MRHTLIVTVATALLAVSQAGAAVIYTGTTTQVAGAQTVLTLDSNYGWSTESGCVGWNGSTSVAGGSCYGAGIWGGDEITSGGQTQTITLESAGIDSAGDVMILFRARENAGQAGITINNLVLRVYTSAGSVLFTSGNLAAPVVFASTNSSTYYVFRLDAGDQAAAGNAFANPSNRIGLAALVSGAGGGPESFLIGAAQTTTPEPVTFLLVGLGLLGVSFAARRRGSRS